MNFETIIFEKKGNIAEIRLNRPDKLNALNNQVFNELNQAITMIELDESIWAVVLTGEGKAFAAGADIVELNQSDERSGKLFSEHGSKVMVRLEDLNIPVIAAVNGFALGGGCELALSCHIRFASEKAKFGQPEVNLGILPGYGGTQRLPRIVGSAKAMELIISGDMIDANSALNIGLVNAVYAPEDLLAKTYEYLERVVTKGQLAVRACVKAVKMADKTDLKAGLQFESELFGEICGTEDFKEGTLAFIEKRPANFKLN